ncbi:enoyl-CoA hydratase-related protein [Bradyrhizobium sp. ISRA443]|uniref:enoyl-CoA hydratase-related protein n=1 Tax=unclassified Bradyrhizobium TaxID=2631580 RepID=UPI00247A887C|nr:MULTISPECIES: enoyl-CoA hydratase-related protein [unclassified Bradyrhizobium]WGR93391.1 enoyl-CoA hydratase-related protein [Bradyrhizobium sp. ISRA435]WGR97930.1 enoyl-CoA hydratase-related protein [Bradyrhizobium sp. ISRA436]WGS04820.1 enoyl-CoA hydratase-related protein [Bradyrhizobium sp. ISRA437]WGS11701.1 enoyl-CoA hydratase-related protein [Bradyrhizobium sp. ISRA443]
MLQRMEVNSGTGELLAEIRDRVAIVTLNRPEARNAFSNRLTAALRNLIKCFGDDPQVGSILITGAGTAFCAGGDVKSMGQSPPKTRVTFEKKVAELRVEQRALTGALVAVRKPTVAAIPGPAAGAGLALALACDIRIAARSAVLTTAFARIGLSGDYGIAWLLTRLAGFSRARELMFLSERLGAQRAEAFGLVNRVVPDAELRDAAFSLAASLAGGPPIAFNLMKDNLDHAVTSTLLESLDYEAENVLRTEQTLDHKEGVRAFTEKRKPVFRGH